jgi:glycosyltransferase involved in cell wall biosynthesis
MKRSRSLIYVNFSPYENTGNIFDFILDHFLDVYCFTFDFHKFSGKQAANKFTIYHDGKLVKEYSLFSIPVPESLVFFLLPIRSFLIIIQLGWYIYRLPQKVDIYFTVNAFTAWIGMIVKKLGFAKKTIFWVWDYYPPAHKNVIIRFMRWLYWYFDKKSSNSDHLVFLNERLATLRKQIGVLSPKKPYIIIPIGTNTISTRRSQKSKTSLEIGFLGVVKKSQGLDIIFDNAQQIKTTFMNFTLHVIGDGPDREYFEERAKKEKIKAHFYKLVKSEKKIESILSACHIGIATYIPEKSNVSFYGDPSKIKFYMSLGLPVVTTDVFEFSKEIKKSKSGIIIDYYTSYELIKAFQEIMSHLNIYQKNAKACADKFNYKKIYLPMFPKD